MIIGHGTWVPFVATLLDIHPDGFIHLVISLVAVVYFLPESSFRTPSRIILMFWSRIPLIKFLTHFTSFILRWVLVVLSRKMWYVCNRVAWGRNFVLQWVGCWPTNNVDFLSATWNHATVFIFEKIINSISSNENVTEAWTISNKITVSKKST